MSTRILWEACYRHNSEVADKTRSTSRQVKLYLVPRFSGSPLSIALLISGSPSKNQLFMYTPYSVDIGLAFVSWGRIRSSSLSLILHNLLVFSHNRHHQKCAPVQVGRIHCARGDNQTAPFQNDWQNWYCVYYFSFSVGNGMRCLRVVFAFVSVIVEDRVRA